MQVRLATTDGSPAERFAERARAAATDALWRTPGLVDAFIARTVSVY
jgi:hypothetical protein